MSQKAASRSWGPEEDALLREGVHLYGATDKWKDIAAMIPGRNNKACRKRWLHSLRPSVKKCAWSVEEDKRLLELYNEIGPKWSHIARGIPGRTDDACSKRYREALDPCLKKDPWDSEEDARLVDAVQRIGQKWMTVGQELGRGGLDCRNRMRYLERKHGGSRPQQTSSPGQGAGSPSGGEEQLFSTAFSTPANETGILPGEGPQSGSWPPYYSPDVYSKLLDDDHLQTASSFHGTIAEYQSSPLVTQAPAPFQFSSSSLSTALSAPLRSLPLPPETPDMHANHLHPHQYSRSQPVSQATSPLIFDGHINNMDSDFVMSQAADDIDDLFRPFNSLNSFNSFNSFDNFNGSGTLAPLALPVATHQGQAFVEVAPQHAMSPISPSVLNLPSDRPFFGEEWKSPNFSGLFSASLLQDSPSLLQTTMSSTTDLSSAASTPYITTPLSSTCSPNVGAFDFAPLPNPTASPEQGVNDGGSLLLSVSPTANAPSRRKKKESPKASSQEIVTRLSSVLKISSDPNVRPYACGHESCWSALERTCFSTSKELSDHHKDVHGTETGHKLFRCGLKGCEKGWKSINGLQYHLQISPVHFKSALQSRISARLSEASRSHHQTSEQDDQDGRKYYCTTLNCFREYRQASGLRYHLKHGHPPDLPTQLSEVPPVLQRDLPKNAMKLRPNPSEPGLVLNTI
ncbi:hypothetical protein FA15DRAFT_3853 [Coprinopsis marcescibilis]|uniref:C2H2-type domain-containing protein n=1 Tax=Coprinopsis marcescibilis TaxID=230819 RepID=A0A5C3LCK9_COPMA|nr:hypothetical protein FA15DRAFT_3853 [Coprinopsis marcescibilis]